MAKMNNKINDDKEDGSPSSKKSYFIAEFALKTNNFQERKVLIKFNAILSIKISSKKSILTVSLHHLTS